MEILVNLKLLIDILIWNFTLKKKGFRWEVGSLAMEKLIDYSGRGRLGLLESDGENDPFFTLFLSFDFRFFFRQGWDVSKVNYHKMLRCSLFVVNSQY